MPDWEYKKIQVRFSKGWTSPELDPSTFEGLLNQLGIEGWELVSTFATNLKRPCAG